MAKQKISLVLEGGGMRGAYTAGCLSWLIDEGLEFDCCYGISTGAIHLCSFLLKSKDYLHEISTKYIADKSAIGFRSFFREGRIVSYDYLFNNVLVGKLKYSLKPLIDSKCKSKIGVYDLNKAKTEYIEIKDINIDYLKAACSLPVLGKVVEVDGKHLLDGGITKMIPIEQAIEDKMDKHLIITTKPAGFSRKPAKSIVVNIMKWCYPECKQIGEDYRIRHQEYNDEISLINQLADDKKAVYMYPSKTVEVSRIKGDPEKLSQLYELGRSDMEARRKEIYELFK